MGAVFESGGRVQPIADLPPIPVAPMQFDAIMGPVFSAARPERGYLDVPVRTVVDFIARHISSLPLKTFRRLDDDARERVRDTRLAGVVRDPSRGPLPPMRFWYSLIADGLLADRMLATVADVDGRPRLKRIPPDRWEVLTDLAGQMGGVRVYHSDGTWADLDLDDPMILDIGYAFSGATGVPQATTLKAVLDEYRASVEYRADINRNTARSPFAVLRDRPWPDKEARERFQRGMRAFVSKGGNAGSGMLLDDGMKIESLSMFKPIDVGDLEARTKVKIDVANAYGIPAEVMGLREGNFSNLDAFRQMLWGTYLRPYIVAFEQAIDRGLRSYAEPGEYVEFDLDAQLRGNPEAQFAAMSTATGRPFMTTNEIRARMNLPPVEGGDELVTPLNVLVGGQTSPQDGETEGRSGPNKPEED
mgnify:CR=1 FL=1